MPANPNPPSPIPSQTSQTILDMAELLRMMMEKRASDLHIAMGAPPVLRIDGQMIPTSFPKLTAEICQHLVYSLLTDTQKQRFESVNELDISFGIRNIGRVRMNVFRQRGAVGATFPKKFRPWTNWASPLSPTTF
jgi:twitching motility protein PilT